jgi:hypothetical protein
MKVYNSGDFIMKEKEIINGYISILKEKERYFKNMELIYKLLKLRSVLLVKKIKYKENPDIMKALIRKENKVLKSIKILEDKNKDLENKQNTRHLFNMNFMSLKEDSLLINDQIIGFMDELSEEEQNTNLSLRTFSVFDNKKNTIDLEIISEDEKLKFILLEENMYNNIDKEKIKKYNYIIYRGDSSICMKNFIKLLYLDLKKDKAKRKKFRRVYDKY